MKKRSVFYLCAFYFLLSGFIYSQDFKIVVVATPWAASNTNWLTKVKTDCGATGVCIQTIWRYIDTSNAPGLYNWTDFDNSLQAVANANLDIYVRVSMGLLKPK